MVILLVDRKSTDKNLRLLILTTEKTQSIIWQIKVDGAIDATKFGVDLHKQHRSKLIIRSLRIRHNRLPSDALSHNAKYSL